jgi:hypothetical protein
VGADLWCASAQNPTLQSVFAGETVLTFQNTVNPSLSLLPSSSATNNSLNAAIFYSPDVGNSSLVEQFFCRADTCEQTNSTSTAGTFVKWECSNLQYASLLPPSVLQLLT